ncbi:MAG: hypothetical protein AAFX01_14520, partial [Cyanobacteria bacterium J06638_28]
FAKAIGSNLVVWALEEIEAAHGDSYLETLPVSDLKAAISQYINEPEYSEFETKLNTRKCSQRNWWRTEGLSQLWMVCLFRSIDGWTHF